jgi:hypothetical protein
LPHRSNKLFAGVVEVVRDQCLLRDEQNVNVLVLGSGPHCVRETLIRALAPLEVTDYGRSVVMKVVTVDWYAYEDYGHVTSSSTKITGEVKHVVFDYSDRRLIGMIGQEEYLALSLMNSELGDDQVEGTADNINDAAADGASLVSGSSNGGQGPPLYRLWGMLVGKGWSLLELGGSGFKGVDTVPLRDTPNGYWRIAQLVKQSPDSLGIEARKRHLQNTELLLVLTRSGKQRILNVDNRKITFYGFFLSDHVADAANAGTVQGEERVGEDVLAVETRRCEAAKAGAERIAASGGVTDGLAVISLGIVGGPSSSSSSSSNSSQDSVGVHWAPGSEKQSGKKLAYLGKTRDKEKRLSEHLRGLKDGSHPSPYLRGAAKAAGLLREKLEFRVLLEVVFPVGTPVRFSTTKSHGEACLRVYRNCADQHPPSSPLPFAALRLLPYW